jgi:hypothetical protein
MQLCGSRERVQVTISTELERAFASANVEEGWTPALRFDSFLLFLVGAFSLEASHPNSIIFDRVC